ncbi:hypothetical protein BH23GEM8_BH23GEM8_01470 [soil metagenome]
MSNQPDRTSLVVRALIVGLSFLVAAAALSWLTPEYISTEAGSRLMGVLTGGLVVLYANAAPKALTPLSRLRCDAVTEQALRRFTGWALTIGGLAYALIWVVAPLESANMLAMGALGTAFLLVVARMLEARRSRLS